MSDREPNWKCPDCGHTMWAEFSGTVDFSIVALCSGCMSPMNRLDRLGEIEVELADRGSNRGD